MNRYKILVFPTKDADTPIREISLEGEYVYSLNSATNIVGQNSRGNQSPVLTIESVAATDMESLLDAYQQLITLGGQCITFQHLHPEEDDTILLAFEKKEIAEYKMQIGNSTVVNNNQGFNTSLRFSFIH